MVVGDIIRRMAAREPKSLGVVFEECRYTWQEINERVNSFANALLRMGLRKQDRVAILSSNCNQYLEYYLAVAKAGLIAVPIDNRSVARELSLRLKDVGANTLVVHRDCVDVVRAASMEGVKNYIGIGEGHPYPYDFENLIRQNSPEEPDVEVSEEDVFVIAYTSGTTGRSKGAIITHRNSTIGAMGFVLEWKLEPQDSYLLAAAFHAGAHGAHRLGGILRGCKMVIINFSVGTFLKTVERERITMFIAGPTTYSMVVSHSDVHKYDLSSLCKLGMTRNILPATLAKRMEEIFGPVIYPGYGLTESCLAGTVLQKEEFAVEGAPELVRRRRSVGKPWTLVDLRVVNEEREDVARDGQEVGEIIMRGDSIAKGYWDSPEETAQAFREGWLYTGDLAVMDEDGYIYITGRKKEVIKSGGMNIFPEEIEEVIYNHPAVRLTAVIGVPDEKWGETPKALIVLKEGTQATEEEIIGWCKQNLASYKKPTSIEFVASLPLNSLGKVAKEELRSRFSSAYVI